MGGSEPEANSTRANQPDPAALDTATLRRRVLIRIPIYIAFMMAVLLLSAGRHDWWMAWAYVGVMAATMIPTALVMVRTSPDLVLERMKPKPDAKRWDKLIVTIIAGLGPVATWVVAGLDQRFGWTAPMGLAVPLAALAVALVGQYVTVRAMLANRFFSAVVRIQRDRGHTVVCTGPYAVVRHPGYTGAFIGYASVPLVLHSWWAFVPVGVTLALLVARTALEDRTLQRELDGYSEYAGRVRYRLVPGIW